MTKERLTYKELCAKVAAMPRRTTEQGIKRLTVFLQGNNELRKANQKMHNVTK